MALTSCRECARDVSDQARACPHCGSPRGTPAGTISHWTMELVKLVAAGVVVVLILVIVS